MPLPATMSAPWFTSAEAGGKGALEQGLGLRGSTHVFHHEVELAVGLVVTLQDLLFKRVVDGRTGQHEAAEVARDAFSTQTFSAQEADLVAFLELEGRRDPQSSDR